MILGAGDVRIWGMTARERLRRTFARARLAVVDTAPASGGVVLALGGWVYDESLLATLAKRPGSLLTTDDGEAVAAHVPAERAAEAAAALERGVDPGGLQRLSLTELSYNEALRKREPPVLVRLTPENVRAVEARTFAGSYKGVTDVVTKYWWPVPARIVTRWCAVAGLRPNHVTFIGFLLTLAAFWLFWEGQFGWGLVCAWIMTFLDTVDGKLARVTLTSSAIGNVFRLITARRNPHLLILTPAWLAGYPEAGFYLGAIWTGLSLLVHAAQLVQAMATPRERVVSWLSR